jgi:hypothetical protein
MAFDDQALLQIFENVRDTYLGEFDPCAKVMAQCGADRNPQRSATSSTESADVSSRSFARLTATINSATDTPTSACFKTDTLLH